MPDEPVNPSAKPAEHAEPQWEPLNPLTLSRQQWMDQALGRAIAEAVEREREACAKIVIAIHDSIKEVPFGGDWIGGSQRAHNAVISALAEVLVKIRRRSEGPRATAPTPKGTEPAVPNQKNNSPCP